MVGAVLTLSIPIVGVTSEATVSSEITGGADELTDDQLREQLLERIQTPPNGGGPGDYEGWAKEVAGVTRAVSNPALRASASTSSFKFDVIGLES